MISLTLGDKKYVVPTITARALREIEGVEDIYNRAVENEQLNKEDFDTAIDWMCLLFKNQFQPDDVLNDYPVDRFWPDVFYIYLCVKSGVTDKLADFPTLPEAMTNPAE